MVSQTQFSQLHWRNLIQCSDEQLARYDLAAINLACALDLPETEHLDIQKSLQTLDLWAEEVAKATQRCPWFRDHPEQYDYSFNLFRIHVMFSVLCSRHGFQYNPDYINLLETEEVDFRAHAVFIHGLLAGKGGTCSSMPVLFIAVGRRLGYPLKLVRAVSHYFVRWDAPDERFNIEVSNIGGFNCHPDDYYRTWPFPMSPQKEVDHCLLSSLTPRRELAAFLYERGFVWHSAGNYKQAVDAYVWASVLEPENLHYQAMVWHELSLWTNSVSQLLPARCPRIESQLPAKRRYPDQVPFQLEKQILTLEVLEWAAKAPEHQRWWQVLRKQGKKKQWPQDVPKRIRVALRQ